MITFSTIPTIVPSRDPFFVDLFSSLYKTAEGAKSEVSITFPDIPNEGDTLTIAWGDTELIFTFTTDVDDSGFQILIPEVTTHITTALYVRSIMPDYLKQNLTVLETFDINTDTDETLLLQSKDKEELEDLSMSLYVNGNTTTGEATIGSAPEYLENFKINFNLINVSNNNEVLVSKAFEPNSAGKVSVNMIDFLADIAESTLPYPVSDNPTELADDVIILRIRAWETYGMSDDAVTKKVYNSSYFRVLECQTAHNEQAKRNALSKSWWDSLKEDKGFLTKAPTNLKVLADQKVFLKYLEFALNSAVRYMVIIGNNTGEQTISFTAVGYTAYFFDISPEYLGISLSDTSYQVYVRDGSGNILTEIRYFYIISDYFENQRSFVFRNPRGGYDTLIGLGISTVTDEFTRTEVEKVLPRDFTYQDRETKSVEILMKPTFKANLGFLQNYGFNLDNLVNYIRQMYSSLNVFEIINGTLYPIIITNKDQKLMEDGEYLPDWFEMEYTRAFVEKGVPAEIVTGGPYNEQYNEQYDGGTESLYDMPDFDDDKSALTTTFIATKNFTYNHIINVGKTVYASINTVHSIYRNDELIAQTTISKGDNINGLVIFNIEFDDITEATYFKIACKNTDLGTSLKGYTQEFITAVAGGITRMSPIACFGYSFANNYIIDDDINDMLEAVNSYANGTDYDANPIIDISGGTNGVPSSDTALDTRSAMLANGYDYADNL